VSNLFNLESEHNVSWENWMNPIVTINLMKSALNPFKRKIEGSFHEIVACGCQVKSNKMHHELD
jgi:hypothetical protein